MRSLIQKYRRKGVLLDSNLLLGYLVGSLGREHLAPCRAFTRYFGEDDFPLLVRFISQFNQIVTTPHVLTEVSNLSGRLEGSLQLNFRLLLRTIVGEANECFDPARAICAHAGFGRLGVTDAAIATLAPRSCLVLTDDAMLADLLGRQRTDVINFNHVRMGAWR